MNRFISVMSFGLVSLFAVALYGTPADSILRVKRVENFKISGDGSNDKWHTTEWVDLTRRKGEVNYATRFKTLYSETGIYCLFHCEDSFITSTMKEDFADIYREDVVEAFFWTDESRPLYFEYELSPTNFELPILVPNHDGNFLGWRPWHYDGDRKTSHAAKVQRDNKKVKSWTAEFFIPFALLKPLENAYPVSGTHWRANFYRIDYDKGSTSWEWKTVKDNFHDFKGFGILEFE